MIYRADTFKLPKPNKLHQKGTRDCGVCVFAELAGVSYEQVIQELPGADEGTVTVDGWIAWMKTKGINFEMREGCPADVVPCAHLVSNTMTSKDDFHWVLRDEDGDVHDPSPVAMYMPADDPRMRDLETYAFKKLTLSAKR
jgi:hypothetical protein